jgi:hypothetical protein
MSPLPPMKRFGGNLSAGAQGYTLFRRSVKDAVDLHDIIVEQAPDLVRGG